MPIIGNFGGGSSKVDKTLLMEGVAADAKAAGEAIEAAKTFVAIENETTFGEITQAFEAGKTVCVRYLAGMGIYGIGYLVRANTGDGMGYHEFHYVVDGQITILKCSESDNSWTRETFYLQNALSGTEGQIVGFNSSGKATAQDFPQSNWNQNDESALDYIKNKPTVVSERVKITTTTNDYELSKICHGDGVWMALGVGDSSNIWRSFDGITWELCNTTYGIRDICYGDGKWFIVGNGLGSGFKYSNDNGDTWNVDSYLLGTYYFNSIHYSNGLWVMSTESNGLGYSTDGTTWIKSNITSGRYSIFLLNGMWFATGNNSLYYSTDGMTWTQSDTISANVCYIEYGNGIFVSGCELGLYYSTDGTTWTHIDSVEQEVTRILYANTLWVAGSKNGLYYSTNGVEWSSSNIIDKTFVQIYDLCYVDDVWLASDGIYTYYSVDGEIWNKTSGGFISSCYHDDVLVLGGIKSGNNDCYLCACIKQDVFESSKKYTDSMVDSLSRVLVGQINSVNGEIFNEYANNKAIGEYSHAEGYFTTTSPNQYGHGIGAHAEGYGTTASNTGAHAEGYGTTASGYASHSEGDNTIAASTSQHVQGEHNIEDAEDVYAHIVGNGNYGSPSNAHTLDWEGNAWFAGDVYVGSTDGVNRDEGSVRLVKETDLAQPDWNENDSTASDYVKNRSHYQYNIVLTSLGEEQTLTPDDIDETYYGAYYTSFSIYPEHFEAGKTYVVTLDGVEYECVAWYRNDIVSDYVFIGNGSLIRNGASEPIDTSKGNREPFLWETYSLYQYLHVEDNSVPHTVHVSVKEFDVATIPEYYIPSSIQRTVKGTPGQVVGFDENGDAIAQDMPNIEIEVDSTLTVEGAAADSKAVGDAITSVESSIPTVYDWAKASTKPSYTKSDVGLGNVDNVKQYSASNPPPYPVTSVNGKTGALSLTASDVGAASSSHTHSEYAALSHTHNEYASSSHTHSEYAPAYTYGTTSLTAGSSSLASGKMYLQYS